MNPILINYLELQSKDLEETMAFYGDLFEWTFTSYGPSYISFDNAGMDGGFFLVENPKPGENRTVLLSEELELVQEKVRKHGIKLTREIYEFPGGQRFEFDDPSGNKLAVWSKLRE